MLDQIGTISNLLTLGASYPSCAQLLQPPVATTTASASSIRTESDPSSPAVPSSLPEDADDGFPLKPPPPPGPEETFKMFGMPYSTNVRHGTLFIVS